MPTNPKIHKENGYNLDLVLLIILYFPWFNIQEEVVAKLKVSI